MPTVVSVFGVKPFRIGGTETFARELSQQLCERGWTSVLCFLTEPSPEVRNFLALSNTKFEVIENGVDFNLAAAKTFNQILRRYQPEIIHLHFVGFLGVFPWLARLHGVKQIFFTDHSSRPSGYIEQRAPFWKRTIIRVINWPITKVICVSKYGYACITALDVLPRDRFELIYNAVDLKRILVDPRRAVDFRRRFSIPDDRLLVLQVSWIIPEKGIPDLIEAARLVLLQNDSIHFVIAGEGSYRQEYSEVANRMGIGSHVTWTGLLEDPIQDGVYDAAAVICQASRWEELFGWVIAEGMAYAKPVVATKVGGIPEVVADGESGFLVERGDVAALADRILRLVQDPGLRHEMGNAGAQIVRRMFNLEQNVSQLIDSYKL